MADTPETENGTAERATVVVHKPGQRKSDELKAAVFDAMVAILRLIARIASSRNGNGNGVGH